MVLARVVPAQVRRRAERVQLVARGVAAPALERALRSRRVFFCFRLPLGTVVAFPAER